MSAITAWHYTHGEHALSIMQDGAIKLALASVNAHERPAVWFSTDQRWEPTASKLLQTATGVRLLTMLETRHYGCGLWRFGVPAEQLLHWPELRRAMGLPRNTWRQLEKLGRQRGADPDRWYGSLAPVAVDTCVVERMCCEGATITWSRFDLGERRPAARAVVSGMTLADYQHDPLAIKVDQ